MGGTDLRLFFVFFSMIFMHIVDDYYLQGILAKMKQKSWWKENAPSVMYEQDYVVALITHSFSWTFMIMLPIAICMSFNMGWMLLAYPINTVIHAITDHLKANKLKINLIVDQYIHFVQIAVTFVLYVSCYTW